MVSENVGRVVDVGGRNGAGDAGGVAKIGGCKRGSNVGGATAVGRSNSVGDVGGVVGSAAPTAPEGDSGVADVDSHDDAGGVAG